MIHFKKTPKNYQKYLLLSLIIIHLEFQIKSFFMEKFCLIIIFKVFNNIIDV